MYLGIDIGTSAVKSALVGADLALVASEEAGLAISHPARGWSEQAPDDWWTATLSTVRRLLERVDGAAGAVRAIGLSGQMHGAVLLDAAGAVIRPAILWNDGRSEAECEAIAAGYPEAAALAGVRPMPGFTAPKILWLAEHEPESYARIARILLPKDFVGHRLHGGFVTDASDAAGTFWLDQARRAWSDRLCEATRTDPAWLPEVKDGTEIAGRLTAEAAGALGLAPGLPVAAGGGDAAAGAIAVGAVKGGSGFISLGTSGQLFVTADRYAAAPEAGVHSFAHCVPGTWFQMAAMLNGARPLGWFSEVTGRPVGDLLAEAEAASDASVPLFLPYLTGERTPHGDARIRGAFYGLANGTSRGEMMRAIVEAVAYSFADAAEAVGSVAAIPDPLLTIGGGTRGAFLLQSIADATGLRLARGRGAEVGPALGAARLAAVAAGDAAQADLARMPEADRRFDPDPATAGRHRARLESYRALYRALLPMREAAR